MGKYELMTINCGGADCSLYARYPDIEAAIESAKEFTHDICCTDSHHSGNGEEFAEANILVLEDDCGRTFEGDEKPQIFSRIIPYRS